MRICLECKSKIAGDEWRCTACCWTAELRDGFPILAQDLTKNTDAFPVDAHHRLFHVEAKSFWFVSRNKLLLFMLNRHFPRAVKMLEIGCGTGFVLSCLSNGRPEMDFFGAEAYPLGLLYAKERMPKAEFAQMDVCRIPFVEEFDVVGVFDVLEHVHDDDQALREVFKALKPGGGIMLTVPQHQWLWSKIDERCGHKRRYTSKMLKRKVELAGFQVGVMTSFITLLLPFMLVSRMLGAITNESSQTQVGLRMPSGVNAIFNKVCTLEQALLIRRGLSLPVGGSLMMLARKPSHP
jgi:SAM-dependent methyltransferase